MEPPPIEPMLSAAFRVRKNRRETADTRTLELVPRDETEAPAWRPGQFMMLYVFGVGEIPISISGDPAQREAIVHTVRAAGAVSRAICEAKPGFAIGVRGPFGSAWPMGECEGDDVVLVAGGIGLAPLRPVLYAIMADRARYRRVSLLIGARTPDILLYPREFDRWRARDIDVRVTVDAAALGWEGSVGPVTTLVPRADFEHSRASAFIVGPEIMMKFAVQALSDRGVPRERLFVSMERNMKCAIGFCGHCQLGPAFICKDGPVFAYPRLEPWLVIRNI
ncbi:MAG: FAD/NAD(P)-binding protein [Planctomycetes bacterium]|nr:FAD/NAD(P)-binding protein [Planctomycetota bacterium]